MTKAELKALGAACGLEYVDTEYSKRWGAYLYLFQKKVEDGFLPFFFLQEDLTERNINRMVELRVTREGGKL